MPQNYIGSPEIEYIGSFLRDHEREIDWAWFTDKELVMELSPALERSQIVTLFADLITFVNPKRAYVNRPYVNRRNNAQITLEF